MKGKSLAMTAKDFAENTVFKLATTALLGIASLVISILGPIMAVQTIQVSSSVAVIEAKMSGMETTIEEVKKKTETIRDTQQSIKADIEKVKTQLADHLRSVRIDSATNDHWRKTDQKVWALELDKSNQGKITVPEVK